MEDDFKGWGKEAVTPDQHAYYEAGHAVMYYLLKTGRAVEFVPNDKSTMLPPFPGIKIHPHGMEWGELTTNLGSMMTAAQVLLAGWVALDEKSGATQDLDMQAIRIRRALHLCTAYAEEYVSDTDFAKRDKAAHSWLKELHTSVRGHIRATWGAVEALAQAVLTRQSDLTEAAAFALIEAALKK